MEGPCTVLSKFGLVRYFSGALLTLADVVTDILTAVTYYNNKHYIWFGFCLAFAFLPSFVMMVAYIVQSYKRRSCVDIGKGLLFYVNPFGSGIFKLKLFIVCLRHFKEVWSKNGYTVLDERLRVDYRSEKVYHYIEGLLENMPQMILQVYATSVQDEEISVLQYLSVSVTYVNLVGVLTMFEYGSFPGNQRKWPHLVVVLIYNSCLIAARALALVSFLIAFKWLTSAILVGHEIVCISTYIYRNHEYFSEKHVWWVAFLFMPCYSFAYLGFKVKELYPKTFEIKLGRSLLSSSIYYFFFTTENLVMVLMYYDWSDKNHWYSTALSGTVVTLTSFGALVNLVFTYVIFHRQRQVVRPSTAWSSSKRTNCGE